MGPCLANERAYQLYSSSGGGGLGTFLKALTLVPDSICAHSATNATKFAVSDCELAKSDFSFAVFESWLAASATCHERTPNAPKRIAVTAPRTWRNQRSMISGRLRSSDRAAILLFVVIPYVSTAGLQPGGLPRFVLKVNTQLNKNAARLLNILFLGGIPSIQPFSCSQQP